MSPVPEVVVDGRDAMSLVQQLLARQLGYVPEWQWQQPANSGADAALVRIVARYLETIIQRLNRAPEKNRLAFFAMLGLELVPPQAARVPVVFEPLSQQRNLAQEALNTMQEALKSLQAVLPSTVELPALQSALDIREYLPVTRAPAGTQVAAPPLAGATEPVVFETEKAIGITTAQLRDVVSLVPAEDKYIDHSEGFQSDQPFQLFSGPQQWQDIGHKLYLAHDTLLALAGKGTLTIAVTMENYTDNPLRRKWEYWDGDDWQTFDIILDETETSGFKWSGKFQLSLPSQTGKVAPARSVRTTVNGVESFWIRGRLALPLAPNIKLPLVKDLQLGPASINRTLTGKLSKNPELQPSSVSPTGGIRVQIVEEPDIPQKRMRVVASSGDDPSFGEHEGFTDENGICDLFGKGISNGKAYELKILDQTISHQYQNPAGNCFSATIYLRITGLPLDKAFADGVPLDISKAFYPFGASPQPGSAFYFTNEEAFSKPGANLQFYVARTASAKASGTPLSHSVAWEYWNGREWATLFAPTKVPTAPTDLNASGIIDLTDLKVPDDLARTKVNGQDGLWMRVRLVSGGFGETQTVKFGGCDLRLMVASDGNPEGEIIRQFQTEFDSKKKECAVLIVRATSQSEKWTVAGFNDKGEFCTVVIDDPNHELSKELKKESRNKRRMVELATSSLGRTQFGEQLFSYDVQKPPLLADFRIGYSWDNKKAERPKSILTYSELKYETISLDKSFLPFRPVTLSDATPALYLGFDDQFPADRIGLLFNIKENHPAETQGPALVWEYWNGQWKEIAVVDETRHLRVPGILSFIGPTDSKLLTRFDKERHWLRGRLRQPGTPGTATINGIFPNATWALQQRTFSDTPLGSSSGAANQIFRLSQTPVLVGERIEVRELEGARANVEWRILAREFASGQETLIQDIEESMAREVPPTDIVKGDLRLRFDRDKKISAVWVRWQQRPHLFFSEPKDRHYVIDRARGQIFFGDGLRGSIPPAGAAILVKQFHTGSGLLGNVKAKTVSQLLAAIAGVQQVSNPRPAEGGANSETLESFSARAPKTLRHLGRAITAADYEAMAHEASPAVAVARVMPLMPSTKAGTVNLLIIPNSQEACPQPSFGLREQVRKFIEARAPADISQSRQINVIGPDYFPVTITATVVPTDPAEAGSVKDRARVALEEFLHPLRGGPERRGWEPGRDVFLSDVAAVLERVAGVDFVATLVLSFTSPATSLPIIAGEEVQVPPDKIVVAGDIQLTMQETVT